MGSSSSPSRTTQVTEPPAFIQPYMQYGAQQARGLYETGGPKYYEGNTVVPFSRQTEQALGRTEQRALSGSPVNTAAQNYATDTLTNPVTSQFGGASNPYGNGPNMFGSASNPHLDATFNKAAQQTRTALDTQFAGSGRNLTGQIPARSDQLNDLATQIYGGAYDQERNRQLQYQQQLTGIGAQGYESERGRMADDLQAQRSRQFGVAGLAPTLANQDYVDLNALQGVGGQVEDLTGRLMEDRAARWDFAQNAPQVNLDNYISRISGSFPGSSTTSTTPIHRNRTAGALGGAASGAAMGSSFGPWGTAIGAVAGGWMGGWG